MKKIIRVGMVLMLVIIGCLSGCTDMLSTDSKVGVLEEVNFYDTEHSGRKVNFIFEDEDVYDLDYIITNIDENNIKSFEGERVKLEFVREYTEPIILRSIELCEKEWWEF